MVLKKGLIGRQATFLFDHGINTGDKIIRLCKEGKILNVPGVIYHKAGWKTAI
jgi:hypothetical protein